MPMLLEHRRKNTRSPSKPRRARGTGAFFWSESAGVYIGRVKVGRRADGKPLYRERRATTQRELQDKLAEVRPPGPDTTLAQWAERWFKHLGIRDSSRDDYRHTLDRFILPTLGHVRLRDLTPVDIEHAARRWSAEIGRLGPNTVRKNLGHLSACLEDARRARLIPENPVRDARRPRKRKSPIDPFTPAELLQVIRATGASLFSAMAAVGCRIGEAMALDVGDFNPATRLLKITKTFTREHGLRRPKSENGVRTVRVPRCAVPAFEAAIAGRKSGPLFASRSGGRRCRSAANESWVRLLKRLDLRYRRPHQIRHSVATIWVSKGVPIGDVAKHLGDSISTVMRTYVHPFGTDPCEAMEAALGAG